VSEIELNRATNYLAGQAEVHRQTIGGYASEIADAWLLGDGASELVDVRGQYLAVTRERVRDVAQRYFDANRRVEGIVRGGAGAAVLNDG
jgi:predicted Zn-dependent peptidase